ncbi:MULTISPECIES: hypothetical protein [Bacillaceae]|uniref:Uncharacterized protein n=1 Tax=Lederbergia citri TaxID=2833580 RepID=A0A942TBZ6_9BACI|nr:MULTISPECIES: hypothetical protein [Bacillaceae]MBS4193719.1 hypothetical protein [Lederbergia citri]
MFLGVVFDLKKYNQYAESIKIHGDLFYKKTMVISLNDVSLLNEFLNMEKENNNIQRVIIYDYEEFRELKNFKIFENTCSKHRLEFSILRQDLHSDVPVELGYMLQVI